MTEHADLDEWVDIDEAARRTKLSKRTLVRRQAAGTIETKTVIAEKTQRNRRTLFKVSTLPLAES